MIKHRTPAPTRPRSAEGLTAYVETASKWPTRRAVRAAKTGSARNVQLAIRYDVDGVRSPSLSFALPGSRRATHHAMTAATAAAVTATKKAISEPNCATAECRSEDR